VNTDTIASELAVVLPGHLLGQRWYGGKGRDPGALRITAIEQLQDAWPALLRVVVECEGAAGVDRYQLLLGLRPADDPAAALDADVIVGELTVAGRRAVCFDALADRELALAVLGLVDPGLSAHAARPVGADQSNSSMVYDDRLILKLFRRLASPNPDVEVTVGLARVGFAHVAEPLGVWRRDGDDLALVQRFLSGGTDAWTVAVASAREVLAPGSSLDPGADVVGDIAALGDMTARMHRALAEAFGTWPAEPSAWADAALRRVGSTIDRRIDKAAVAVAIDRIRDLDDAARAIRIHGDYHLGQVLRADGAWYVFDFEGEPTRPVEERRAPSSPLRDVAGMLRSFAYVAGSARRSRPSDGDAHERLRTWEIRLRRAFLAAYFAGVEGSDLLPANEAAIDALLTAFEIDKAVYEVAYEQGSRPDWVDIPLDGLRVLLARGAP
jgi:maltokinase